jgi:hypothetical protein
LSLIVPRFDDTKCSLRSQWNLRDRNEIDARRLRAVDAEELDLSLVTTPTFAWPGFAYDVPAPE